MRLDGDLEVSDRGFVDYFESDVPSRDEHPTVDQRSVGQSSLAIRETQASLLLGRLLHNLGKK